MIRACAASLVVLAAVGPLAAALPEQNLESSLAELAALREQIAAEKIPLTRELQDLEERLAAARRTQDETLRQIDTGSLDTTRVQQESKLRQDELSYVTSVLDEYARTFETRLAVGELPRYREALEAAKDAPTNPELDDREKLDRQLAVVEASIERARSLSGGDIFAGQAVGPAGELARGRFAVIGPVVLFASDDLLTAGVAFPQAGAAEAAVRPLEDNVLTAGVASLIAQGEGTLPLDPTRGGALKALVQKTNLVHIFKKGGPIMWPLLLVSILALGAVLERILFLANEQRKTDFKALQKFFGAAQSGDLDQAIRIGNTSKFFVVRTLAYALEHRERSLPSALMYANMRELKRFTRGIPILDTSITVAPLLGLLGTVTGMMNSFSLIGGELSAPGAITGGIAEALIATAFGLGIAIICVIPYNYLNNRVETARHELEVAGHQLELILRGLDETSRPSTGPAPAPLARAMAGGR